MFFLEFELEVLRIIIVGEFQEMGLENKYKLAHVFPFVF